MKMIMTLTSQEAGKVTFERRPGAVLDAGMLIGRIKLDDASLVTVAQPFKNPFPESENYSVEEKLNRNHHR